MHECVQEKFLRLDCNVCVQVSVSTLGDRRSPAVGSLTVQFPAADLIALDIRVELELS